MNSAEPSLYLDRDMQTPVLWSCAGGTAALFTARSPDKETANEDGAAIISLDEKSCLLVVTDGMGGGPQGEHASRLTLETLQEATAPSANEGLRESVLSAVDQANSKIRELGIGAATTLAIGEITEGMLRSYHVGDAHLLLVGQRGKIKRQTIAHAPVSYAVESGMMAESDAMHHEDRHLVSNVVGQEDMRIELGSAIRMCKRDTLLLATDGLFDNLLVDEIVDLIRIGPIEKAMQKLIEACRERMGGQDTDKPSKPDDFTAILFRLAR